MSRAKVNGRFGTLMVMTVLLVLLASCAMGVKVNVAFKGINYVYFSPWWLRAALTETRFGVVQAKLDALRLKSLGFNHVQIPVYLHQDNRFSNNPYIDFEHYGSEYLDVNGPLAKLVKVFKEVGFHVCLYVRVNVDDGTWCGLIKPSNITRWFENYLESVKTVAIFAKRIGVDCLVVAAELDSLSGAEYDKLWSNLVRQVKEVFDGLVIYSFPYKLFKEDFDMVETAKVVDVIASNIYEPVGTPQSTLEEVYSSWLTLLSRMVSVARRFGKPIYIAETSCRSVYGSITRPWQAGFDDIVKPIPDFREQVLFYEGFFRALKKLEKHVLGYSLWAATPGLGASWYTYEFTGHPAEEVIARWQGGKIPDMAVLLIDPGPEANAYLYYDYDALFAPYGRQFLYPTYRILLNVSVILLDVQGYPVPYLAKLELQAEGKTAHMVVNVILKEGLVCGFALKTNYDNWVHYVVYLDKCRSLTQFNITLGAYYNVSSGTWWLLWIVKASDDMRVERHLDTHLPRDTRWRINYISLEPYDEPQQGTVKIAYDELHLIIDNITVVNIDFGYTVGGPLCLIDISKGDVKLNFVNPKQLVKTSDMLGKQKKRKPSTTTAKPTTTTRTRIITSTAISKTTTTPTTSASRDKTTTALTKTTTRLTGHERPSLAPSIEDIQALWLLLILLVLLITLLMALRF